jgi:uncharacterized repeat protein (TIGR02059 family)
MRNFLVLVFILIPVAINATNYYVSNAGSDSNDGKSTLTPWQTISKVNSTMSSFKPGDQILFNKGDTWNGSTITIGCAGTSAFHITIGSYGSGNKPIIQNNSGVPIYIAAANRGYWTIDGLDLRTTYVNVNSRTSGIMTDYWSGNDPGATPGWLIKNCNFNCGIFFAGPNVDILNNSFNGTAGGANANTAIYIRGINGSNAVIENNVITNFYGRGIWIMHGANDVIVRYNTIHNIFYDGDAGHGINNDGYGVRNDAMQVYGNTVGNVDEIGINGENAFNADYYDNYVYNCGWYGFDIYLYSNGDNNTDHRGQITNDIIHNNIIYNCNDGIMAYDAAGYTIANNVFYKNDALGTEKYAFYVTGTSANYSHDIVFVNNIIAGTGWTHNIKTADNTAYPSMFSQLDYNDIIPVGTEVFYDGHAGSQTLSQLQSHGLMTHGLTIDPSFVSAGSDFHLQAGSPAIGKGITISGITTDYEGTALKNPPSIGAYENTSYTSAPVVPVYQSSAVANATPSLLEMTYNMTLSNILPASSAFSVKINSIARTVNTVAISGAKVQLTLASPIVYGDVVTVSYNKSSANPIQTTSGGQAVTISAQTVTNNVSFVIPIYVSSAVANATPSLLEMTYNITLANIVPAATSFKVMVNSVTRTVSSVAISGTKVQLTLSSAIKFGDIVTFSYTKPSTNPLQSTTGGVGTSISAQSVTNNLINEVKDATPVTVTMTLSPNHVHKILNIILAYSSTAINTISPEIIKITDLSGTLCMEQLLVTGVTNVKIPINIDSGVYTVIMLGNGAQLASQKMIVY